MIFALRTILMYFVAILAVRLMGKRVVNRISPHDLVVLITIGSVIRFVMTEPQKPLIASLIPLGVIATLQIILAIADARLRWVSNLVIGQPTLLVKNGEIQEENLKGIWLSRSQLESQLRSKGVDRLKDVQEAYLETSGDFSVIKKKETSVSRNDLSKTEARLRRRLDKLQKQIDEIASRLGAGEVDLAMGGEKRLRKGK